MDSCEYCGLSIIDSTRQYCPHCGKLIQLIIRDYLPKIISIKQISLIQILGIFLFFVLYYFSELKIFLILISFITSFVMVFVIKLFMDKEKSLTLTIFFPQFKQFMIFTGILIWSIENISSIILNLIFSTELITIQKLIFFTIEFIFGYLLGLLSSIQLFLKRKKEN